MSATIARRSSVSAGQVGGAAVTPTALRTRTTIRVTIGVMPNSGFAVGDRVIRVNDGKVGVITTIRPGGDIGVRWEPSGVVQLVVPGLLKPA